MNAINENEWEIRGDIPVRKDMNVNTQFSDERQDTLFEKEENSWWFIYRANIVKCIIDKYFDKKKLIWDIGAGNAYTSFIMQKEGYNVATMEPSYEACKNAKKRGIKNVYCGTLDKNSINDASLESIIILDVIEHLENDFGFIELMYNKLVEDSYVLITVPAFMSLWSSNDVFAGHFRRYRIAELKELCMNAGFSVVYDNYFMHFCFVPVYLIRVLMVNLGLINKAGSRTKEEKKRVSRIESENKNGIMGGVLKILETIELFQIKKGKRILYGSSLIMVLKK